MQVNYPIFDNVFDCSTWLINIDKSIDIESIDTGLVLISVTYQPTDNEICIVSSKI